MRRKKRDAAKEFPHKEFWITLSLLLVLSIIYILNYTEPTVTGGVTIHNIAYLQAGRQVEGEAKDIIGLFTYVIYVKETIKNGQVVIKQDETIPFVGVSFSKFSISSREADKIEKIELVLKILEQDLLRQGIATSDVRLFVNGREVPTTLTKLERGFYVYSASVTELGGFVIGKRAAEKRPDDIIEEILISGEMEEQPEPVLYQPLPPKPGWWEQFTNWLKGVVGTE